MVELIKRLSREQKQQILRMYNEYLNIGYCFTVNKINIEGWIFRNTVTEDERKKANELQIDVTTMFDDLTDLEFKNFIKNIKEV